MGAELTIFSPSATGGYTRCAHSCMHVTPESVPPSGKLTSTPMEGDHQALNLSPRQKCPAWHVQPNLI